jgi:hypothetical protein
VNEARLRRLIGDDPAPTRSHLEDEFLRFAERYDLPTPEVNQRVAGHEVDMLWRDQRLIVELAERRGRDSNPRTRLTPVTRFPVVPVQPLRHLSWKRMEG